MLFAFSPQHFDSDAQKKLTIDPQFDKFSYDDNRVNIMLPPLILSNLVQEKRELKLTPSPMRHGDNRVFFSTYFL